MQKIAVISENDAWVVIVKNALAQNYQVSDVAFRSALQAIPKVDLILLSQTFMGYDWQQVLGLIRTAKNQGVRVAFVSDDASRRVTAAVWGAVKTFGMIANTEVLKEIVADALTRPSLR